MAAATCVRRARVLQRVGAVAVLGKRVACRPVGAPCGLLQRPARIRAGSDARAAPGARGAGHARLQLLAGRPHDCGRRKRLPGLRLALGCAAGRGRARTPQPWRRPCGRQRTPRGGRGRGHGRGRRGRGQRGRGRGSRGRGRWGAPSRRGYRRAGGRVPGADGASATKRPPA